MKPTTFTPKPVANVNRFVFVLLFLLAACEGPVGPQGPQGQKGDQGERGLTGEKGDPGNANVATFTVQIDTSDYFSEVEWDFANYLAAEITEEVFNNGAVVGYVSVSGDQWGLLPAFGINFSFTTGVVIVTIDRDDGVSQVWKVQDFYLRFVVIYPPAAGKLENVDIKDYEAVMGALRDP